MNHQKQPWLDLQWWVSPFGLPHAFLNGGNHVLCVAHSISGPQQHLWSTATSCHLCGGIFLVLHHQSQNEMVPILLQNRFPTTNKNAINTPPPPQKKIFFLKKTQQKKKIKNKNGKAAGREKEVKRGVKQGGRRS
jgi:hypothetical protein